MKYFLGIWIHSESVGHSHTQEKRTRKKREKRKEERTRRYCAADIHREGQGRLRMIREELHRKILAVRDELKKVIKGKDETLDCLLTAVLAGGNVLMEDIPGVGKTTLAKALSLSIQAGFSRIQFTPDLLPADILGSSVYNPKESCFIFHQGPIFSNIVLADEINRASPRTQSALLEAMNEKQISIEGECHPLPKPFMVIATENPVEYYGTYPLPEAQLDRFAMKISLGYPDEEAEAAMLEERRMEDPLLKISARISCEEMIQAQEELSRIQMEKTVTEYMLGLVRATRSDSRVKLGASPRSLLTLSRCAQARAWYHHREYVIPDDVRELAVPVLAHRLLLNVRVKQSGMESAEILRDLLQGLPVPR